MATKTMAKKATKKPAPKRATKPKVVAKRKVAKKPAAKAAPVKAAAPKPAAAPVWAWHELMTSDVASARRFYGALFGWGADEMPMAAGPYTVFTKAGDGLGGCMAIPQADGKPCCPPNWMVYLTVDDVDASAAKASSLGGTVQVPPTDIPGIGRFAIVIDPAGAVFGLYQTKRA